MDRRTRAWFDRRLEEVLASLPDRVREMISPIPLYVEDYPSRKLARELGLRRRSDLCGLFSGVPLHEKRVDEPTVMLPDRVTLFREGILAAAASRGRVTEDAVREEIRITLLHEYGHYYGMSEEELE
ncbi:MAG: metallopeptidase family protein, partial [Thermogutta sp.]|nr:metallopeptidase family protein [Thermogutta sp.]